MNQTINKTITGTGVKILSVVALFAGITMTAHAGTTYYVYQKGDTSTCDISTKSPDEYNRGSQYHLVASDSTRSGAKKQGQEVGCSSF